MVGDIHGCYDELMQLVQKIHLKDEDLLISVGDIVNKGNQSKQVYQYFKNRPNSVVLMGNHEKKHLSAHLNNNQKLVKEQFGEEYPQFIDWLKELKYYYEAPEALIIHAYFEHDKSIKNQKKEVLCGQSSVKEYLEKKYGPEIPWYQYYKDKKPIIYGHKFAGDIPKVFKNTIGIDTGCCNGNYLTAIELSDFSLCQIKAKQEYWKRKII